ncbi:hypothetical protein HPB51_018962 [Rhipicephalus microplus]|uniref:Lipocalin-5 1 n=1 Tax=Rhipicephalus microplus TaxID=6941 RepID=A0A9J6D6G3_RHIMP|nr:hypothetical protein HPB51_018962 [Rhipicephalus microplus]
MAALLRTTFVRILAFEIFFLLQGLAADHQSKDDVVDAFKAMAAFPYAVALADTDRDGDLDCMAAVRREYSNDPPRAVFDSFMKRPNGEIRKITYHVKPGPTIDSVELTVNDDYDHVSEGRFFFSDYKDCVIMEFPIDNKPMCVMWTLKTMAGDIPAICTEKLQASCEDAVLAYDEDTCGPLGI